MSHDIETLLRHTGDGAPPVDGLIPPSQVRRRGDRRRAARRGSTVAVAVLVVSGAAVWVGNGPLTQSFPPAQRGSSDLSVVASLPPFPVSSDLHHGNPAVPRTTGKGPNGIAANMVGTTTTYFTCVGGGPFKITLEGPSAGTNGPTWSSGDCTGDVDTSTLTYGSDAANVVIRISLNPGAAWAVQVVPGTPGVG